MNEWHNTHFNGYIIYLVLESICKTSQFLISLTLYPVLFFSVVMVRNQMQHDKAVTLETPSTNNFLQELLIDQVDW